MPDDNLFDDTPPKDSAPTDDTPGDTKDEAPDTSAQVAALQQQVTELTQARDAGLGNAQQLAAAIQALQQQIGQLGQPQGDDEPPAPMDAKSAAAARQAKFEKFYEDPEAFIAREAEARTRAVMGPYLRMQAEQRRDEIVEAQRSRIDDLHGKGTWDKYFAKDLADTFRELPLELQSSRTHVQRAVESIYGRLHLDDGARAELLKARDTTAKAKAAPPSLMDGGRPAPKADTLDEAEQAFLASLQRSGIDISPKEYLAAKSRGNTEDAWRRTPAPKR